MFIFQAAWAPSKGVKESRFKEFWDVDLGVTYIPWADIPDDLDSLAAGGALDEDTLPDHMRGTIPLNFLPTCHSLLP